MLVEDEFSERGQVFMGEDMISWTTWGVLC